MPSGRLRKMHSELTSSVEYWACLDEERIPLNPLIGKEIQIAFSGKITCSHCGARTKKSYAQGFCYPCMRSAPETSECVIHPERCQGHLGLGRDPEWEARHHVQPHLVYLSLTSQLKVGVTRADQEPTRWIDQGASAAVILARVPNRFIAGEIEVELKADYHDKTSWQKMLRGEAEPVDLLAEWEQAADLLPARFQDYVNEDPVVTWIDYPLDRAPLKPKSLNLDKTPTVQGILSGIRGQYLIFDDDRVLNLRRFTGYEVSLETL